MLLEIGGDYIERFFERAFENAKILGCRQYVIADFNMYRCRNKINDEKMSVFRLDYENKILLSEKSRFFDENKISFWYLDSIGLILIKKKFIDILMHISKMTCKGSELVFNYPTYSDAERKGYSYEEKLYKSVAGISSHDHLFISESL